MLLKYINLCILLQVWLRLIASNFDHRIKIHTLGSVFILYLPRNNHMRLYSKDMFPIIRCTINVIWSYMRLLFGWGYTWVCAYLWVNAVLCITTIKIILEWNGSNGLKSNSVPVQLCTVNLTVRMHVWSLIFIPWFQIKVRFFFSLLVWDEGLRVIFW